MVLLLSKGVAKLFKCLLTTDRLSTVMYIRPARTILAITLWKQDAAPFNPIGKRHHEYSPEKVMNAVNGRDWTSIAV
jgi:hypothetical protein